MPHCSSLTAYVPLYSTVLKSCVLLYGEVLESVPLYSEVLESVCFSMVKS